MKTAGRVSTDEKTVSCTNEWTDNFGQLNRGVWDCNYENHGISKSTIFNGFDDSKSMDLPHGFFAARSTPVTVLLFLFAFIFLQQAGLASCFGQAESVVSIANTGLASIATQDLAAVDGESDSAADESDGGAGSEVAGLGDNADPADSTASEKRTMLEMMFTGNAFGVGIVIAILLLSVVSTILIVENAISIRRKRLLPPDVVQSLESALALRDTRGAMMICNDVDNHSLVTQVVQAGLERFRSSEFGFAEYRSAVEEAGDHVTGQLYRKVEVLNVIASIAPMLGLTGTVLGMIDAFNTIAANEGVAGPEDLAGGIGQALITTLLGLLVAIPTMVAFSFFRSRIDSLVSEAGTRIERMMLPLGRRKNK